MTGKTVSTDWVLFEKLIEQFANDLPYFPEYFSVYNEPENNWQGSPEEMVRFLTTIARAIKKVHPETKVLGPGLATINITLLRKWAGLGLFNYLDGVATNAYVDGTKPEAEFIDRIRGLKNFLVEIGRPELPIYITEFGWTSAKGTWQMPVDELTQARYAARSLALLREAGIHAAIYFCLRFNTSNEGEEAFSVIRADGTPKPAYVAFATVSRMLGREGDASVIESSDSSLIFQLIAKNRRDAVVMVWMHASGKPIFVSGELFKGGIDMMGREIDLSAPITISESPVYLVPQASLALPPTMLNTLHLKRGQSVEVSLAKNVSIPQPLKLNGNKLDAPMTAALGTYWLISAKNNQIAILPVAVSN